MTVALAAGCAAILAVAAGWHLYWSAGGGTGRALALPQRPDGTPVMPLANPGTAVVGIALAGMAAMPLIALGAPSIGLPAGLVKAGLAVQGAILAARGLAWHRYVGLFKSVRGTPFGRLDTRVLSPLSLAAGLGCLVLAATA